MALPNGVKRRVVPRSFVVQGSGDFPLDMLRYDSCYPETEAGSNVLGVGELRAVRLQTVSETAPTVDRWRSFGWTVVEGWSKR